MLWTRQAGRTWFRPTLILSQKRFARSPPSSSRSRPSAPRGSASSKPSAATRRAPTIPKTPTCYAATHDTRPSPYSSSACSAASCCGTTDAGARTRLGHPSDTPTLSEAIYSVNVAAAIGPQWRVPVDVFACSRGSTDLSFVYYDWSQDDIRS